MQSKWVNESFTYDGYQLRSSFGYSQYGILGDSLISWRGSCDVQRDHIVDIEDLLNKSEIHSQEMVHFIIEMFNQPLSTAVAYQRLFVTLTKDVICQFLSEIPHNNIPSHLTKFYDKLKRKGDDLYFEDKKINVSVATTSPISSLIHVGVNVISKGTPVPTMGLNDFNIDPYEFSKKIMDCFVEEYNSMKKAMCKVKWVR